MLSDGAMGRRRSTSETVTTCDSSGWLTLSPVSMSEVHYQPATRMIYALSLSRDFLKHDLVNSFRPRVHMDNDDGKNSIHTLLSRQADDVTFNDASAHSLDSTIHIDNPRVLLPPMHINTCVAAVNTLSDSLALQIQMKEAA